MVQANYSPVVKQAQEYYNSDDADNFYFHIWGGEDIHVGIYEDAEEPIPAASERTVAVMADHLQCISSESHVLDLGAGYGGAARWLARNRGCWVTCLNLSEAQNERNRAQTEDAGLSEKVHVIDGDFENIPLPNDHVNAVWSQDSILHSGNRAKVLKEIDRVLKPGGEVIFTDPMQANDCPDGVLQPVLDRIHLDSLGSPAFYQEEAARLGWQDLGFKDLTEHLVHHYSSVRNTLELNREKLAGKVSDAYVDRMVGGLKNWVDAGRNGYLAWGILHFKKPA